MQMIRNLNIIILAFLMILTGCFGLADDAVTDDAEGQTTNDPTTTENSINHAPFIGDSSDLLNNILITQNNTNITYDSTTGDEIVNGFSYNLYHSVVDIDGDAVTCGWDVDLDGTIDHPTSGNSGLSEVYVELGHFTEITSDGESVNFATVAFIAVDEHGLGNAMMVDIMGEYYNDDWDSGNGGSLQFYTFSGYDAPGSDGAVIMTMDSGSDLGWASITIKASVDGAASSTVPACDATVTTDCWSSTDGDTVAWNVGEAITIDTSCTGTCTVTINILNSYEGVTLDTTIVDVE